MNSFTSTLSIVNLIHKASIIPSEPRHPHNNMTQYTQVPSTISYHSLDRPRHIDSRPTILLTRTF
jgi:hypothetical protein